jgi:predicted ATPase
LGVAPFPVVERIVQDGLRQITRAELAFPRANTTFSGDQEYIFKASLLREVAYSLIPNKHRVQYHLAVARWLATRTDTDFKLMAAEHFEVASAFEDAAREYEQAARSVRGRGAFGEAQAMSARARELREKIKEQV